MMKSEVTQQYSYPALLAILLHIIVLSFLIFQLSLPTRSSASSSSSVNIIHAVAINQQVLDQYENAVQEQKQAEIAQQQAKVLAEQKAQQEAQLKVEQAQQQLIKQQQLQQQIALQKLQAQQQAQKEAQAKQAAAQAAQLKAQQVQAEAQKAAQQKVQATALAKASQQKAISQMKQQLMQQMQGEISSDQNQLNQNAAQTQANIGEMDKYKALIIQAISQQWIMPQHLPNNISCELDIRVAPGGAVIQVSVSKSSGNSVLDSSAVAAVNKASPLPVPTDSGMFDQFRELHLIVKPDGSMVSA